MNRSRASSRLTRRQTKNSEKSADGFNGKLETLGPNGEKMDEIDIMFGGLRSKRYPICAPLKKEVNTHNLAEIPSLQPDEDSSVGGENGSQNSEYTDSQRKNHAQRKNANSLIESRNKFRQLLGQIQSKNKINSGPMKLESSFDGYDLKSRKVKYEPRKLKKEMNENSTTLINSRSSLSSSEFCVKLFDKTVDLSGYCKYNSNQYISLYPICRLWARNNYGIPDNLRTKRTYPPPPMDKDGMDFDGPYSDSPVDVNHLPRPTPLPRDENGNQICLRIPKFVREFKVPENSTAADDINKMEKLTSKELLALNMPHWKEVRKEFLNASRENEQRYSHSFAVLKSMFDKSNDGNMEFSYYKYPPYESDVVEPVKSSNSSQSVATPQSPSSSSTTAAAATTTTTITESTIVTTTTANTINTPQLSPSVSA